MLDNRIHSVNSRATDTSPNEVFPTEIIKKVDTRPGTIEFGTGFKEYPGGMEIIGRKSIFVLSGSDFRDYKWVWLAKFREPVMANSIECIVSLVTVSGGEKVIASNSMVVADPQTQLISSGGNIYTMFFAGSLFNNESADKYKTTYRMRIKRGVKVLAIGDFTIEEKFENKENSEYSEKPHDAGNGHGGGFGAGNGVGIGIGSGTGPFPATTFDKSVVPTCSKDDEDNQVSFKYDLSYSKSEGLKVIYAGGDPSTSTGAIAETLRNIEQGFSSDGLDTDRVYKGEVRCQCGISPKCDLER